MKKQPKPWLIFSGLFFQIAIVMFVLTRLGNYADSYFQKESNQFTLTLSLPIEAAKNLVLASRLAFAKPMTL